MQNNLNSNIDLIQAERSRHIDLPGSEWDAKNTPGDWIAMINHYTSAEVRRNGEAPSADAFRSTLVKSAAVILAALEHIEVMKDRKELL